MFNYLVLKDGSVASFIARFGQEKYYVFLICSQEKHLHFEDESQEKSEKNIRQDVYESWTFDIHSSIHH